MDNPSHFTAAELASLTPGQLGYYSPGDGYVYTVALVRAVPHPALGGRADAQTYTGLLVTGGTVGMLAVERPRGQSTRWNPDRWAAKGLHAKRWPIVRPLLAARGWLTEDAERSVEYRGERDYLDVLHAMIRRATTPALTAAEDALNRLAR